MSLIAPKQRDGATSVDNDQKNGTKDAREEEFTNSEKIVDPYRSAGIHLSTIIKRWRLSNFQKKSSKPAIESWLRDQSDYLPYYISHGGKE